MAAAARAETFATTDPFPAGCAAAGPEADSPAAGARRPSFEAAKQDRLGFVQGAIAQIARGEGAQAALREMSAFLLDLLTLVERDPGLELAADDLYEAAVMLAADRRSRPGALDPRLWRLLKDAARRFRMRLDAACPSGEAQLLGFA